MAGIVSITSYPCHHTSVRFQVSLPNVMAAKQRVKVLQHNYENISLYKDHIHSPGICTKPQRVSGTWWNKWVFQNIIYFPICNLCKCTNSQAHPSYSIKQTLVYRREWQNAVLPIGTFSEEIIPIKMSSKSRKGKICYRKVEMH